MLFMSILLAYTSHIDQIRPLLLLLLVLAILFLLAGAIIALVALRKQKQEITESAKPEKLDVK
jgi:flagellar basal body-associated protein FliL